MSASLLAEWRRLVLAPDDAADGPRLPRAGNAPRVPGTADLKAHAQGRGTLEVDLTWNDGADRPWVRAGVLNVNEELEAGLAKAAALIDEARARRLAVLPALSGGKGIQVWLFCEPVPAGAMAAALARLKQAVPLQGESSPGDRNLTALAPAFDDRPGRRTFFYAEDHAHDALAASLSAEEFLRAQGALLSALQPTPADVLLRFAYAGAATPAWVEMVAGDGFPDLQALGGTLPPCMAALLDKGGSTELGTFHNNDLVLAGYARCAGLCPSAAANLAQRLATQASEDLAGTKHRENEAGQAAPGHDEPTLDEQPFNCAIMRRARQSLGFRCEDCAARPATLDGEGGARFALSTTQAVRLMSYTLGDRLLFNALHSQDITFGIDADVFPRPVHRAVWRAIMDGADAAASVVAWLDAQSYESLEIGAPTDSPSVQASRRRAINLGALRAFARYQEQPAESAEEAYSLVIRARALSEKLILSRGLSAARSGLSSGQAITDVVHELVKATRRLQTTGQDALETPLSSYGAELLEVLEAPHAARIPTPFQTLNRLLGGGWLGGHVYLLGAESDTARTTLAAQFADFAAFSQVPVAYAAFEMGRDQLFTFALARRAHISSAVVEAKTYQSHRKVGQRLVGAAATYMNDIAPWLYVIEGDHYTTAARLAEWTSHARAKNNLSVAQPVLIVVDYLQLMSCGDEALDQQPADTARISQVSLQLRQLARDTSAAVLVVSDISRPQQGHGQTPGQTSGQAHESRRHDLGLNCFRGSHRIGYLADAAMVLYSESTADVDGQTGQDPWESYADQLGDEPRGQRVLGRLEQAKAHYPTQGPGAGSWARLEILKNRSGRGRGSQLLVYERAMHRFGGVDIDDPSTGR